MGAHLKLDTSRQDFVELLQITDAHIFADKNELFDGVDTQSSLTEVINLARNTDWSADAILATGDLVHDPEAVAYERLLKILTAIEKPVFCLPGNHDSPELMHQILNTENVHTSKSIELGQWLILMLDSFLPDTHSGYLQLDELNFLRRQLQENADKHVLVCLHHSPVSIGSEWMDGMCLENPEDFFAVLDKFDHVRAVLWGHIHQEFFSLRHGVSLMATPSTCVQFLPGTGQYQKDHCKAGYRYLKLHSSGAIGTEIRRLN